MASLCKNCGKQLSFFKSIFSSLCSECQEKNTIELKKIEIVNPVEEKPIQQRSASNRIFRGAVGGEIEYYNLQEWWQNSISAEEQNTILSVYKPLGLNTDSLIHGKITSSNQTEVAFLTNLSSWFKKPEYRKIGYKLIEKAESAISNKTPILDKHFLYQTKLEIYYRNRDTDDFALSVAIDACKQQIAISAKAKNAFLKQWGNIPSHKGYQQLCIIMEKQKNFDEAIRLAKTANEQGWTGDWDKRIENCIKKNL